MDPHAPRLSDMHSGMSECTICLVILQVQHISLFTISCWNSISFLDFRSEHAVASKSSNAKGMTF